MEKTELLADPRKDGRIEAGTRKKRHKLSELFRFDSQTKETMTLQSKDFGSKFKLSEKFLKDITKCGVVESIMSWIKYKQQEQADKKCASRKMTKLKVNPSLHDI